MTETAEQLAQRIQDARGYIVIRSLIDHPVGHVFEKMHGSEDVDDLECKTAIIAKTDFADWKAQHEFAGLLQFGAPPFYYFYYFRVRAE